MAPVGWGAVAAVRPTLPARGLRRAAKGVPTEGNRVPGGMTQNMAGTVAPVRRLPDVKAAGPMTGADSKLLPPNLFQRSTSRPAPGSLWAGEPLVHRG